MWGFVSFGITDNDLYYAERADEVYIIGSKNTDPEIIIPQIINGKAVTRICNNAFYYSANLESVIIPDSITVIGNSAFSGCSNLTTMVIGSGVKSIGDYAFSGCSNLKSVIISNNVTSIGGWAFNSCSKLESVIIGNGVTSISDYAFNSCENLRFVVIGSNVTSIKNSAFSYCYYIEAVYYVGTSNTWNNIVIDNNYNYNSYLINANRYYYSETQPTTDGNFWHYVDGVPTPWIV
jgi:hypothetical protein